VHGEPVRVTRDGVLVKAWTKRDKLSKCVDGPFPKTRGSVEEILEGEEKLIHADVIVLATGYKEPSIDFLPRDLFPEGYRVRKFALLALGSLMQFWPQRPDLYLQHFSTEDWSILMTNSGYMKAIGTV